MSLLKSVEEFLSPAKPHDFFDEFWEKKHVVFKDVGFSIPFGPEDFENLLTFGKLSYPQVMCYDSSGFISPHAYTTWDVQGLSEHLDVESISNLLHQNKTVRIADLPTVHPGADEFAQGLSKIFGCNVNINAYFSRGPCRGLRGHYDPHHVFALQLHGEKLWDLGDVVVDTPSKAYSPRTLFSPDIRARIATAKGEMLYMPPGMWHATTTQQISLHVTIGIHPPRWSSLLTALVDHTLKKHPVVRASLPMELQSGKCVYQSGEPSDLAALVKLMEIESGHFPLTEPVAAPRMPCLVTLPQMPATEGIQEEFFEADDEEITVLLGEIWHLSNSPCSIYFRGSFPKKGRLHAPWDLDIYFVVNKREEGLQSLTSTLDMLQASHPTLPEIDLTIVTKSDLLSNQRFTLHRLLLSYDAVLAKGEPLKSTIEVPAMDNRTALQIKAVMEPFINRKLSVLAKLVAGEGDCDTDLVDATTKTVAKAALRTGTFLGIQLGRGFSREIDPCADNIVSSFPDMEPYVSVMLGRIRGTRYPLDQFVNAADTLRNRIYGV